MIFKTYGTFVCCCLAFINLLILAAGEPIVTLPNGVIRGKLTQSSVTNSIKIYYSFIGVRYAEPPSGKTRFLAPVEVGPWNDTYDATAQKHTCFQVGAFDENQSEDCLFLNVFTPQLPETNESTLLPVLFYIHGGGFLSGSGLLGADFFMEYDVILVTINYRLGPFGFASTGDGVIPGNAGLKDQNLALKWVNKNIQYFGGDPKQVTIFGQSAGAASAAHHILSTKSAGLFRAAILQSGSAISPWAYQRDQKDFTYNTAALINSTYNVTGLSSQELFDYLLETDGEAIHNASSQIQDNALNLQIQQGYYFAPVIEPESDDAFISKSMFELLQNGEFNKVPVMMGTTSEECVFFNADYFHWTQEAFDSNPYLAAPHDMHLSEENRTVVGQLITEEYIGKNVTWKNNLLGSIQYFTDQGFARSLRKHAELQSNYTDVYFYLFSYHGKMGLNNVTLEGSGNVTHGEELSYLFPFGSNGLYTGDFTQFSKEDITVHNRLMSLWTNFAISLNPTPTTNDLLDVIWPTVNVTGGADFQYLDIGQNLSVKVNLKAEKYKFWEDLYNQYALLPYDTY